MTDALKQAQDERNSEIRIPVDVVMDSIDKVLLALKAEKYEDAWKLLYTLQLKCFIEETAHKDFMKISHDVINMERNVDHALS